ncbi:MAG: glycosyltransferase [Patescibacteria group bacterium]
MKIALVHDHLTQEGGAEKVLRALHDVFPESPIFTLVYNKKKMEPDMAEKKIIPSFLQKWPLGVKKYQWFLMWMPAATENYDLSEFDTIISSSSAFAKGVITKPGTRHICYCHTPTRYLWTDSQSYIENLRQNRIIKKILPIALSRLRLWDKVAADRVDLFIANSNAVKKRIEKYYGKESVVVFPPVETSKFFISDNPKRYFLAGGRLVPYKKFDLTVTAFNRLNMPLKIFGTGPDAYRLKKMAKKNIEFLGNVSEAQKAELYADCKAFINPQEEDFGITAVEAMAAGRPVIAFKSGGARDTVIERQTGLFFTRQNWEDLAYQILHFNESAFSAEQIRNHSLQFDSGIFKKRIKDLLNS